MQVKHKRYYPIFWDLEGKRCLVVGGGAVAARKVVDLLAAGAEVGLISREVGEELAVRINTGTVRYLGAEYQAEHLRDTRLVIGATNDTDLNRRIATDAAARGIPCNIVDVPELCEFIVPATVQRGPLTIAVSTAGASPALAKKIRQELEETYGDEYALLLETMRQIRKMVLSRGQGEAENGRIFSALLASPLLEALRNHDYTRAEEIIAQITGENIRLQP